MDTVSAVSKPGDAGVFGCSTGEVVDKRVNPIAPATRTSITNFAVIGFSIGRAPAPGCAAIDAGLAFVACLVWLPPIRSEAMTTARAATPIRIHSPTLRERPRNGTVKPLTSKASPPQPSIIELLSNTKGRPPFSQPALRLTAMIAAPARLTIQASQPMLRGERRLCARTE